MSAPTTAHLKSTENHTKYNHSVRKNYYTVSHIEHEYVSCKANCHRLSLLHLKELGTLSDVIGYIRTAVPFCYVCYAVTLVCTILWHSATQTRWKDMTLMFGIRVSSLSRIFREGQNWFIGECSAFIRTLKIDMLRDLATLFDDCIFKKGALQKCIGFFLNGSKVFIAHSGGPTQSQRGIFSDHNRLHCFAFIPVTSPNRFALSIYLIVAGSRHDIALYGETELNTEME